MLLYFLWFHQHIINNGFPQFVGHHFIQEPLLHGLCVFQAKCDLFLNARVYQYLIIAGVWVHKARHLIPDGCVYGEANKRQWEWVLGVWFVEVSKINSDPPFFIFLFDNYYVCKPLGYCTSLMKPLARSFSISLLILFLLGENLLCLCLTGFAPFF